MKNKKKIIGSTAILFLFICWSVIGYFRDGINNGKTEDIFIEATNEPYKNHITIYVNGEVEKPGVYELDSNSRIEDAIKAAGGFTEKADRDKLNLAKKIKDEDYIYVNEKIDKDNKESGSINVSTGEKKVNINEASKEELKTIPGIGDVTAQNIIDYREENGGFNSIDEIKNINRIGEKTFQKLKDKLDIR